MVSVITPTRRPEGLELVQKAVKRQTVDVEWIVIAPHDIQVKGYKIDALLSDPPREDGDVWTLNKAYNKAIKKASDLIITWQDYTYAKPDTVERFLQHYQNNPKTIVGAVGNKYTSDDWLVKTWQDPRENDKGYYPVYFQDIEGNLASVPKEAFYAVGGFDESLDKKYGMDFYSVMDRLSIIGGWEFMLDQDIKSYSLEHGRPRGWDNNWINTYADDIRPNYLRTPALNYLE